MVLNLVESKSSGNELKIGQELHAKKWNPGSIGGVGGPKFKAEVENSAYFIVGRHIHTDAMTEQAQYRSVIDGKDVIAPRDLLDRLMTTVLFQEVSNTLQENSVANTPRVRIKTLHPTALAQLEGDNVNWQKDNLDLKVNTVLSESFWRDGRRQAESLRRALIASELNPEDKKLSLGIVYPFIPDINEHDMGTFARTCSIEEQLALNITFLQLNRVLSESGLRWRDQGKAGSSNYLAVRDAVGGLNLIIFDYDMAIVDRSLYRSSPLNWKAYDESIAQNAQKSEFNTHDLLSQLSFSDVRLYKALRASVTELDETSAISSLIDTLQNLSLNIVNMSDEGKKVAIEQLIRRFLPDEQKSYDVQKDNASSPELISRHEWSQIITTITKDNVFDDFPRGIHQLDRVDLDFEIESKRTKQVLSKLATNEISTMEALRELSLNLSYCCTMKPGSKNPAIFFRAIMYHSLPNSLKQPQISSRIKEFSELAFAKGDSLRIELPKFEVDDDPDINEWYLDQINDAIKKIFVKD